MDIKAKMNGDSRAFADSGLGSLTKREWMATELMVGLLSNEKFFDAASSASTKHQMTLQEGYSAMAVEAADTLLRELEE